MVIASDPDTVSVVIGSTSLRNWQSVSITRSCEIMPSHFHVEASGELLSVPALQATQPDQPCTVSIGSDVVITGWLDRRSISCDGKAHTITLMGRGLTRSLIDCSVDIVSDPRLKGGFVSAQSTLELAERLSASYGIHCISAVPDPGPPIPALQIAFGESPYEVIEQACRYAAFLVYEDEYGRLVLDRVGTKAMRSGLAMPGNIESIAADRSVDHRYSKYVATYGGVFQLNGIAPLENMVSVVEDRSVKGPRLLILQTEQTAPAVSPFDNYILQQNAAALRAQWERATRNGRSQSAQVTCSTWRDSSGALWQPNRLVSIDAPTADISNAQWVIGTVTFRRDGSGTHADVVLMPPDAFIPNPSPLVLFNNDLLNAPRNLDAPAGSTPEQYLQTP